MQIKWKYMVLALSNEGIKLGNREINKT